VGLPDVAARKTRGAIQIPWVLGLVATRSIDRRVPAIEELVAHNQERIRDGMIAYGAMEQLRAKPGDPELLQIFNAHVANLGYALLLKRHRSDVVKASPQEIEATAWDTVPPVALLFWCFRIMVALGFYFIALFAVAFWIASARRLEQSRALLWISLWSLPLPWIAAELGWVVAEVGRQPWTIDGVLPTFLSVSSVSTTYVAISLTFFVVAYSTLAVVDVFLMVRTVRRGPAYALGLPADAYSPQRIGAARSSPAE